MHVAGSMVLLMFDDDNIQSEYLTTNSLSKWLENIGPWEPKMQIPNRRTWLSISGLPIHLWSEETFSRVVKQWCDLVNIDIETLSPSSFEKAHIQIETDWTFHIVEIIDVRVDDVIFHV
ncbi:hypothetical protein V6N12_059986 [Hibiscus sabdariffa]|uniref:DUF4283 domain-containing protein n=1 Tax=Hibiscus sabdariffa TaxID=183260 RepID=A0ABR2D344_9ROSI